MSAELPVWNSRPLVCTTSWHSFSSPVMMAHKGAQPFLLMCKRCKFEMGHKTHFTISVISYSSFHYLDLSRKFVVNLSLCPFPFNDCKESCSVILITIILKLIYRIAVIAELVSRSPCLAKSVLCYSQNTTMYSHVALAREKLLNYFHFLSFLLYFGGQ